MSVCFPPLHYPNQQSTNIHTYSIQSMQTHTSTHGAIKKWILLYQQSTGHLAQGTAMNNLARGEEIDEKRGREKMGRGELSQRARGSDGTVGAVVCKNGSRGGATQQWNNRDQTCWVNSEREAVRLCVCYWWYKGPLCAGLCRCLCTNTLERASRARLCYLLYSSLHPHWSASLLKLLKTHFTLTHNFVKWSSHSI